MNRKLGMALIGASFLIPIDADAQRVRPNNRPANRYVAPATARLANCRVPSRGRAYVCQPQRRDNVVYRYSGNAGRRARRAWIAPAWGRTSIFLTRRDVRRDEFGQGRLRDLIGPATVRRVRDHGRRAGLRGPVRGHWLHRRHAEPTLVLTMRRQEVARLVDYDRDGFIDEFLVRNFRGSRSLAYGW